MVCGLDVAPRMDTKQTCVYKRFNYHSKLKSQHNSGGPIRPIKEHEHYHLDNDQDIHTSSKPYEEDCYGLNLKLLTLLY